MGAEGTLSRPAMRTTSSTRSAAPWMSGRQLGAVTFTVAPLPSTAKPSRSQGGADLLLLQLDAAELLDLRRSETDDRLGLGRRAGDLALGRRAAGHLQHHGGGEIEARQDERRVDAALEAVARVALHAGLAARGGRAQRRRSRRTRSARSWSRACSRCPRRPGCRRSPARRGRRRSRTWSRRPRAVLPSRPTKLSPLRPSRARMAPTSLSAS